MIHHQSPSKRILDNYCLAFQWMILEQPRRLRFARTREKKRQQLRLLLVVRSWNVRRGSVDFNPMILEVCNDPPKRGQRPTRQSRLSDIASPCGDNEDSCLAQQRVSNMTMLSVFHLRSQTRETSKELLFSNFWIFRFLSGFIIALSFSKTRVFGFIIAQIA
jgi:hypothetical protein